MPAEEYASRGYQGGIHVALVTSATSRRTILAGSAPLFPLTPQGGIYVQCASAPRSGKIVPSATIAFPALTLKLSHGHYHFARSFHASSKLFGSSRTSPVSLAVTITGTVISRSLITGTVKVKGAPCARSGAYSAPAYLSARPAPGH